MNIGRGGVVNRTANRVVITLYCYARVSQLVYPRTDRCDKRIEFEHGYLVVLLPLAPMPPYPTWAPYGRKARRCCCVGLYEYGVTYLPPVIPQYRFSNEIVYKLFPCLDITPCFSSKFDKTFGVPYFTGEME